MPLSPAVSRAVVGAYVRAYDVNLEEAEPLVGQAAYPSFDAFFTRPLRDGARPVDAPSGVFVSPADGRLDALGAVNGGDIIVKGRPYSVADLLGSQAAAARYSGGQFAVIYLSPGDYHRVHTPVAGRLVEVRSCPGDLFPVNSVSERHIPNFLVRNRRVAMELETDDHGVVQVVMVAAMIVGRVTVSGVDARDVPIGTHALDPPLPRGRGAELGVFHLGSTAVLFTEPGKVKPFTRALGPVRLGDALNPEWSADV